MGYNEVRETVGGRRAPSQGVGAGINDQRPQQAAQLRMTTAMANSRQAKRLGAIQAMAAGAPSAVAQRAVVRSAYYTAASTGASLAHAGVMTAAFNTLNGHAQTAEANAVAGMHNPWLLRTPAQNAHAVLQNPASWGICVEEQLNLLAGAWAQQVQVPPSRPDYHMNVGGIDVYADLTTPGQAGVTGDHITGKLWAANLPANAAVAADVTYLSGMPAQPLPPQWKLDAFAARQRHQAALGIRGDGDYSMWAQQHDVIQAQVLSQMNQAQSLFYIAYVDNGLAGHADASEEDDTIGSSEENITDDEYSDG
jgi:hypothetical protein